MNHTQIIEEFYKAFAAGDPEAMVNCYHPNIQFQDPAFGLLQGEDAKNMWRMLIERSKGEIKIKYSNLQVNEKTGTAQWEADYVFRQTGRPVNNKISAHFEFSDGKIIKHSDEFNLWRWSRQALGVKGILLGWSGFMRRKIQEQTRGLLESYKKRGG